MQSLSHLGCCRAGPHQFSQSSFPEQYLACVPGSCETVSDTCSQESVSPGDSPLLNDGTVLEVSFVCTDGDIGF